VEITTNGPTNEADNDERQNAQMDLPTLAAMWADNPTFNDDASNDYALRGGRMIEVKARNANRHPASSAECGHCGRILSATNRKDMRHVIKCESDNRPYAYSGR